MKKTTAILTALLVMAVLFASCSNGMGEKAEGSGSASSSAQKVMVNFDVEIEGGVQRVITANDALNGLTYWYKAVPTWKQQGMRPIAGDTDGAFVQIPGYEENPGLRQLGYFTAGIWNFFVEVRKGTTVVYSGSLENYSIHTGHASIVIPVSPDTGDQGAARGTVTITVTVPTTGPSEGQNPAYHEQMKISYSGYANGQGVQGEATIRNGFPTRNAGITTYTTNDLSLVPGAYTFVFKYHDESYDAQDAEASQNGGAAMAVNVLANQTATITGSIENGKWHEGSIIIKKRGFATFAVSPVGATIIAPTGSQLFECTATSSTGNNNDITYAWYVNGVSTGIIASSFTFAGTVQNPKPFGLYEITCVAYDGTEAVKSNNVTGEARAYVQVAYGISKGQMSGDGDITLGRTYAAYNDIITLTVEPGQGKALTGISVNGNPATYGYDANTGKAYIHMPDGDAVISATFE